MTKTTQKPDQDEFNPAKNIGQDSFDKIIDKNFSPGDEIAAEERAKKAALSDNLQKLENKAASTEDIDANSQEDIKNLEESAEAYWQDNTTKEGSRKNSPWYTFTRNKAIAGGVFGVIFVIFGMWFSLGPNFALIHLKEVMVGKFGDRFSSLMEQRNNRLMAKKFSKEFTKGCTINVKCRFRGMTSREIRKFEKRNPGTKIVTEGRTINGKKKVKSVQYYNSEGKLRTVTASEFRRTLLRDPALRNTIRNYNKPTVAYWRDVSAGKFFDRYKIYRGKAKTPNESSDKNLSEEEREKTRVRDTVRNFLSGGDFNIDPHVEGSSESTVEDQVRESVSDNVREEADILSEDFKDPTKPIPQLPDAGGDVLKDSGEALSKVGSGALKGAVLGPLAGSERACAAKRLISSVGFVSKMLNTGKLISYSMLFMVAADQIKAGDADGNTTKHISTLGTILTKNDPDTGKTFSDSFGFQYASEDKLVRDKDTRKIDTAQIYPYMLGAGLTGNLLSIVNKLDDIPGVKKSCKVLGNTFFQIGAGTVTLVANFFCAGCASWSGVAQGLVFGVAFAVAEQIATPMLARAVAGTIVTGDEYGQAAGNAITSGFGAATAMNIRGHGGFPLSKDKAIAYDDYGDKVNSNIAKDGGLNYQLNTENYNSFASRFASSLLPLTSKPSVTSVSKFLGSSFSVFGSYMNASAVTKGEEYKICTDPDYKELNIAAGPFCDPQYGFDPAKVDAEEGSLYDAERVVEYMCGTPINSEAGCAEDAYINDDGDAQGEYAEWITNCVEDEKPITSSGEEEIKKECLDPDKTDNPIKYDMFRMYFFDTTLDDQYNDRDAGQGENTNSAQTNTTTGSGKWKLNPGANRSGVDLTPLFKKFMDELSKYTSFEPIITTGTNHSQYSASGLVSDHWGGNAADFGSVINKFGTNNAQPGQSVPRGDGIAAAALMAAGISESKANSMAKRGGLLNEETSLDGNRIRVQVIWKSTGHYDHVHVGIKKL